MENPINHKEDSSAAISATLLKHNNEHKGGFEIYLIDGKQSSHKVNMILSNEQEALVITFETSQFQFSVDYKDIIGFLPEEHLPHLVYDIKISINEKNKDKIIEEEIPLYDMKLCHINYYPQFHLQTCSLCGCFCCKCTNKVSVRKMKVKTNFLW